jgi:hypothetical protein
VGSTAPWQFQINAAFQSYSGAVLPRDGHRPWLATRMTAGTVPGALVIPNMTATTYVLDLTPPG